VPKELLKVIALIPILVGGSIAVMVLSYLLVPLFVVTFVGLIAYGVVKVLQELEAAEIKEKEE